MKKLITILFVLISATATAQSVVGRNNGTYVSLDSSLMVGKFFRVPVFTDTTNANLYKSSDSCGKLIFTRDNKLWVRSTSHQWVEVGSGGGGSLTLQDAYNNDSLAYPSINARNNSFNARAYQGSGYYEIYVGQDDGAYLYSRDTTGSGRVASIVSDANGNAVLRSTYGIGGGHFIFVDTNKIVLLAQNSALTKVGIGTNNPSATLEVDGTFKYVNGSEGDTKILVSDTAGGASWQYPNVLQNGFGIYFDSLGNNIYSANVDTTRRTGVTPYHYVDSLFSMAGGATIYTGDGTIPTNRFVNFYPSGSDSILSIQQPDKEFGFHLKTDALVSEAEAIVGTKTGSSGTHISVKDQANTIDYFGKSTFYGDGTYTAAFMNGNVGIGTTTPEAKLHVAGGIICDSAKIGGDWYYSKKITLTPSEINSGNTTPILVASAPGVGYAWEIQSASSLLSYNTTSYVNASVMFIKSDVSGQTIWSFPALNISAFYTNGTNGSVIPNTENSFEENSALYLQFADDNSDGNSNITVYLTLKKIKL